MLNKRTLKALLIILGSTFVLKVVIVLLVIPLISEYLPYKIHGFVDHYDNIARNILAGNGYRLDPYTSETLLRSPGYVLLLTGLFYVFGYSLVAAQVFNIICGLATAYLVALITKDWILRSSIGYRDSTSVEWSCLLPAILFLYHPGVILSETRGGVESMFMLLLTAFVYYLYSSLYSNRKREYILAGITLGLSMLVKSTPALIPIVFLPYLLLKKRAISATQTSVIKNYLIMGLAAFIVLAPWGLRNYGLTGEFLLTSTVKGTTAHQGLYVNKNFGSSKDRDPLLKEATKEQSAIADELGLKYYDGFYKLFYTTRDEVTFDRHLFQLVTNEYVAEPQLLLKSCLLNFGGFWFLGRTSGATYLNIVLTVPLLLLVGWGIYSGYKRRFDVTLLILVICAFILPHLPILGVARYHIPLIPFLSILATVPFMRSRDHKSV